MQLIKKNKALFLTSLIFGLLYATISLVNHYLFRTYALDLGLYTNAIYKYAHFQMADSEMIKSVSEPILGGHFDLYLIIFSDRKSTRLNSSHVRISYAVFCLKKKKKSN